jgi:hypothetical protein
VIIVQRNGDRIDERLIVGLALARSDRSGLSMGLGDELGRTNIGHPNLHRTQPLAPEPLAMLADAITG